MFRMKDKLHQVADRFAREERLSKRRRMRIRFHGTAVFDKQ